MEAKRTIFLVAALPGTDYAPIASLCAESGLPFVEILRPALIEDESAFASGLSRLQERILDFAGYGWADTRLLKQDATRHSVERRFAWWAQMRVRDSAADLWGQAPGDMGHPLVIAGDTLAPTLGLWARLLTDMGHAVVPLFNGLSCKEALALFADRLPDEVGPPGAYRLWLKHTLLCLQGLADIKTGQLVHWPTAADMRAGFEAALSGTGVKAGAGYKTAASEAGAFDLVAAVDQLLASWGGLTPDTRSQEVDVLLKALHAMAELYGDVADLPEKVAQIRVPLKPRKGQDKRPVILHYHLFKNGGTSIDALLRDNFGQLWTTREFDLDADMAHEVAAWVRETPRGRAFSSHTMTGPLPDLPEADILPILFIRHPIDRARSAYLFERQQREDTFSVALARKTDFAGYVAEKLGPEYGPGIVSFNTRRLAQFFPGPGGELERARKAFRELPFVGLVDRFDASIRRLDGLVRAFYPEARFESVHKNATQEPGLPLEARLAQIRAELGDELYGRLEAANRADLALFHELDLYYKNQT